LNTVSTDALLDNDLDDCPLCSGSAEPGWVCEEHPGKPWQHSGCGAAGAPCACNPRGAALWAMVYSVALRVAEGHQLNHSAAQPPTETIL
jgi:hypothetical protein